MLGLVRRNPALGVSAFDDFDRLFDDLFSSFAQPARSLGLPSADIYSEDGRNMVVELQAPGFDRDDISISVNDGVLEIRGQKTEKEESKDRQWMVRESSAAFARRIALPKGADSEGITAELDKGVLKVTVPVEQREAKRIEIAAPKAKKARLSSGADAKPETE